MEKWKKGYGNLVKKLKKMNDFTILFINNILTYKNALNTSI